MKKKVLISILVIVLIISALLVYTNSLWKPLPEDKRNISTSNIQMLVNMEDERTPIIRTYTKEEFDKFDENEINKIKEVVSGNIEGDIPQLIIEEGRGTIEISFIKTDKNDTSVVTAKIIPDNTPKIRMLILETIYSKEEAKEVNDSLIESEEGVYSYKLRRYLNKEELSSVEKHEPYRQSMYIEVDYEINNQEYISIFAINTSESE